MEIREDGKQRFRQPTRNMVHMKIVGNHFYVTHMYIVHEMERKRCPVYQGITSMSSMNCVARYNIETLSVE